eukprot:Protomagalhaensia_sp_Gyna_25__5153@NODE_606_length_3027_cov_68_503012_g469_i0_p1_GENE_NODE_606_length_3027_cov_68_503012_g469_i0NODE_606_length_3027_cov_68_503012_g469_i0_p1_ORF_typecomplete_len720_score133_16tRNAsynt_His/PF13393_6/25tRNAsynt_His/PF13393_6/2_9e99HGTP_anticodon/PF03129_20/2e14HGTP_anticodon2/PF12745_7/1_9e07tRNAsynt_2/PF00152_20/1_2tRNAsynt_2/PF00152_20/22SbcD_C/PF12320_8/0_56SbcD_C/PF12320_8/1_3e04_NODE_606_length_3027_cov_68_503012_g469_i07942953
MSFGVGELSYRTPGLVDEVLVQAATIVECLAIPIQSALSFVPADTPDEFLRARSNSLRWLLEDSKVVREGGGGALSLLLGLLARLDNLSRAARSASGLSAGEAATELLNQHRRSLLAGWDALAAALAALFNSALDKAEGCQTERPVPEKALEFYKTYLDGKDGSKPPHLSSSITNEAEIEDLISQLRRVADYCLYIRRADLLQTNVKKLAANKKNVNWSLRFGRGVEEFVGSAIPPEYARILTPKNQVARKPKTPKGCLDFEPPQMRLREVVFDKIKSIFQLYGAEPIDTPVFELKEILTGKYGEDQKLIYDLKDQGGEQLGLRYDLTVPFARFCATNSIERIKRYHIGKVYRRDEPQVAKGRLREFYQCDVDIAGVYDAMVPESEILSMLIHCLNDLRPIVGKYRIKLSHRAFLDGVMSVAGVPGDKLRAISSAIDKLDKESWEEVEKEMVDQKGLSLDVARALKPLVTMNGPFAKIQEAFLALPGVRESESIQQALHELNSLYEYLGYIPNLDELLVFDTSLARGLDYYTGLIYEAVLVDGDVPLGSIAAGGRYDGLIGLFSGKSIPAVGVSLGIERILRLVDSRYVVDKYKITSRADATRVAFTNKSDVFILAVGQNVAQEKLRLASALRQAGLRVEFALQDRKLQKQIPQILETSIPLAITLGENEIKTGQVKVKAYYDGGREIEVPITGAVDAVKQLLAERNDGSLTLNQLLFE